MDEMKEMQNGVLENGDAYDPNVDDDIMDFGGNFAQAGKEGLAEYKEDIVERGLNQDREFMQRFAKNFSELFVPTVPENPDVKRAIQLAKQNAKAELEAQIAAERKRIRELARELEELEKQR